jgi:hypothetical protein
VLFGLLAFWPPNTFVCTTNRVAALIRFRSASLGRGCSGSRPTSCTTPCSSSCSGICAAI